MVKKIWNWIKKNYVVVLGILGIGAAYQLGRRSADGRGVQGAGSAIGESRGTAKELEEENTELGERIDSSQKRAGELKQENQQLGDRLETGQRITKELEEENTELGNELGKCREILKTAKERSDKKNN